jgi:ribonucleotide reductase beta subunit family protein with ferritin-like domain
MQQRIPNLNAAAAQAAEPLLTEEQRLTVYPIAHNEIWQHYKRQLASFWTPEEIDFSRDRDQWNTLLTDDERRFVRGILAFFAGSDSVVSLNIMNSFCQEVKLLEAQIAYTYQAMMEGVHAEVYSIMIDVYVTDPDERDDMFKNLGSLPSVRNKVEWAQRWALAGLPSTSSTTSEPEAPFARRLLAYAIVEGLFFSGAFCAIYWIKQRNLLPGLTKSNEFIARDEGQHTEFAITLYHMLRHTRLSEAEAHAIFREAVAVETDFITESIPCRLIGMNATLMTQYIEYVADGLLTKLGYATIYGSTNPFDFMDLIGMPGRSNFFEERVSLYQRADVLNEDHGGDPLKGGVASMVIYDPDF